MKSGVQVEAAAHERRRPRDILRCSLIGVHEAKTQQAAFVQQLAPAIKRLQYIVLQHARSRHAFSANRYSYVTLSNPFLSYSPAQDLRQSAESAGLQTASNMRANTHIYTHTDCTGYRIQPRPDLWGVSELGLRSAYNAAAGCK
eukprot:scaffold29251_cov25-Tisochrysis_lutea.AAC.1